MVSDLLSGPRAAAELADAMVAQRYDVLIGTQIVAKGHHFPMLTLVGVVDSDGDKNLAGIRANGVSGIFSVDNNLQVVKP